MKRVVIVVPVLDNYANILLSGFDGSIYNCKEMLEIIVIEKKNTAFRHARIYGKRNPHL